MRKGVPQKAKLVHRLDDDGLIHLTVGRGEFTATGGLTRRITLCGEPANSTRLSGIPTAIAQDRRCPSCYAEVDAYGYPRSLAGDYALPEDRAALQKAAVAGASNVREAWEAMKRIRAALEKRGRVRTPRQRDFKAEADALVAAISSLPKS